MCPILVGSTIVDLCKRNCFGAGAMRLKLQRAYADYSDYCQRHRITDTVDTFTEDRLHMGTSTIFLAGKASGYT